MSHPLRLTFLSAAALLVTAAGCSCGSTPPSANQPPLVTLLAPTANAHFKAGESVALSATAQDPEDGPLDGAQVVWTSSKSGQLATGTAASAVLTELGEHVLTVTATDKDGQTGSAMVAITVDSATAPTVAIVKPVEGDTTNRNQVLQFQCNATAVSGAAIDNANIHWSSELSGALPDGAQMTAALTVAGADTITCTANDPATASSASASVHVTVNPQQAPTLQITQPAASQVYVKPNGTGFFSPNVTFSATARDFNAGGGAGNLTSAIVWTLDPGNVSLGTGATASHTFTAVGDYTVTASATDSKGLTASDSVTVHVVNNVPPQCAITRPAQDNEIIAPNTPYQLQGFCFDPESGGGVTPTWTTSAQAGALGTGNTLTATFTVTGGQTLTISAVDPQDSTLKGSFSRPIRVITNTAPTGCAISAPQAGAVLNGGATVQLSGAATDAEDPQSALRFRWSSNVDGNLGGGSSTSTTGLATAGPQTLTLTVTDTGGLSCSATVQVTINAPPAVAITQLQQGTTNCLNTSCAEAIDVSAAGTATDPQGIASTAWTDSTTGSFGGALTATLTAPLPGKHTIVLSATDSLGALAEDARTVTLLPTGKTALASALTNTGPVEALVSGIAAGDLLWVDGSAKSLRRFNDPNGAGATTNLPDPGLSIAVQPGATPVIFVGTDGSGVTRCVSGTCQSSAGGPLSAGGDVVNAVAVASASDLLLAGTDNGLAVLKASSPGNGGATAVGKRVLDGMPIRAIAISPVSSATSVKAWVATDSGLAEVTVAIGAPFDPVNAATTVTMHTAPAIPDDDVFSVAVSPEDKVFVGTRRGFSELNGKGPALRQPPYNFPDEEIHALLFERRTIGSAPHDLLWAGSRNGLIRYDVAIRIPTRLTTADGLPGNDIRSLELGANGVKYVGTSLGIGKYDGP